MSSVQDTLIAHRIVFHAAPRRRWSCAIQSTGVRLRGQAIGSGADADPAQRFGGLFFDNNGLAVLPPLPAGLSQLICNNNALTSLPSLPATLFQLQCDGYDLTALPALPSALRHLSCSQNQLTALFLRYLVCWVNLLALSPALPNALNRLECKNYPIGVLPALPDSLTFSIQRTMD